MGPKRILATCLVLAYCACRYDASVGCASSGACGDEANAENAAFMQLARTLRRASATEGFCGDPSWYLSAEQCEKSHTPNPWVDDSKAAPVPPNISCPSATSHPWCNVDEDLSQRVDLLVKEMTTSELAAQVSCDIFGGVPSISRLGVNEYNYIRENDHGLLWNDVCPVPTMFPQVITMARSFNKTLWNEIAVASAIETRYNYAVGKQNSLFTQTNFNIFLDPRWGRGQEVPGEDPFLNTEYGKTWVKGVQSPTGPAGVPLAGSSCKHFTAYSLEGAGGWPYPMKDYNRHNFDAVVSPLDLAETHYPMYQGCAEVGALGMMTSYNAVNGVPMAANGPLTNGLAREKWGFSGAVVTDCGAVEDIWLRHKFVPNGTEAARVALEGGTDIECGGTVKEAFQSSDSSDVKALLENAVKRSFNVRFKLGEFDPPGSSQVPSKPEMYNQAEHAKLAYDAAVQGAVLLKNEDNFLPLSHGQRVAVMGPLKNAKWEVLGSYSAYKNSANWLDSPNVVSVVEGLESCDIGFTLVVVDGGPFVCSPTDQIIPGSVHSLQKPEADVVVIVGGLNCQDPQMQDVDRRPEESGKCQSGCLESEGCDRPSLELPAGQVQLIERAASWDIPVVLVLVSGGPVALEDIREIHQVKSILSLGYPGQAAGTALARLLFGYASPSGRLTNTYYRASYAEQVSIRDMRMRSSADGYPGRTYRFVNADDWVVYPFGYGLSYHSWTYAWGKESKDNDPTTCSNIPGESCAGQMCVKDPTCTELPPAFNGVGCNAAGLGQDCRYCGFAHFPDCSSLVGDVSQVESQQTVRKTSEWTNCDCELTVSMTLISNGGAKSEGETSVLLFLVPPQGVDSQLAPLRSLRGFDRVRGTSATVSFKLSVEDFKIGDETGNFHLLPGEWLAEVNQPADLTQRIHVSSTGCTLSQV